MAINLSEADHIGLDKFLETILDAYRNSDVSRNDAVGAIAHVFTAAAIDNASEVNSWLNKPETLATWRRDVKNG